MVAKAQGAYHGSHDLTDFNVFTLSKVDHPIPETRGIPSGTATSTVVFPYNDISSTLQILNTHRYELATVIIEVFVNNAGVLLGDLQYLQHVEAWCKENGVLLTVDEIVSFRTSFSGACAMLDLSPDLVCLGKSIGGGLPVGAFGGRQKVMSVFDPRDQHFVKHGGTFNAHRSR